MEKAISAILLLGNVKFGENSDESCQVENADLLKFISDLIEIDLEKLNDSLIKRTLHARGELITVKFTKEEAMQAKLSFCKVSLNEKICYRIWEATMRPKK